MAIVPTETLVVTVKYFKTVLMLYIYLKMPIFATLHHFRAEMGDVTSSFSDPSVTPLSDYTALYDNRYNGTD